MSLPEEEVRAMQYAREFLLNLATGEIKRIPKDVRKRAIQVLRHYPGPTSITMYWGRKV